MREIKFRAWDKKRKEMRPVHSINNIDEADDYPYKYIVSNQNADGEGIIEFRDAELMQYTGRHDENGKEVYEKDYILYKFRTENEEESEIIHKGNIFFDEYMWCVTREDGDIHSINRINSIAIIGNIYENPELLK